MNLDSIRDADARAVRHSIDVVRQATAADLRRETPCAGWDLSDLLAHMIAQHRGFAAAAAGRGGDLAHWTVHPVGSDPAGEYEAAAADVRTAYSAVRDGEQPFTLPEFATGPDFPAVRAIGFHFIDYVVHAWDVAVTLGVRYAPEADLLEAALPIALAVPDDSSRLRPGAAFAPSLAPSSPDPLARILTALGRKPVL